MTSITAATQYGRPIKLDTKALFDILKFGILKVEVSFLTLIITAFGQKIGFPTIPFRN